jgi:TonB family protein
MMKILKLLSICLIALTVGCQAARPVTWTVPRYPDMLRSANVEGHVVAHIPIAADGTPGRIRFETTPGFHELFGQAIRNAVRSSKFTPATRLGRRVSSEVTVPVTFVLLQPATPLAFDERGIAGLPDRCPAPKTAGEQVVCARSTPTKMQVVY